MPNTVRDEDEMAPQPRGIVEQLVRDDVGRKKFLKAVGSTSAAGFGAFVLAACGSSSSTTSSTPSQTSATAATTTTPAATASVPASFGTGDVGILNYALTLEYLEDEFYSKVIAAKLFTGAVGSLVSEFGQQEAQHVATLHATVMKLGGTPAAKPVGKFPLGSAAAVAKLAYTVENLGAAAYLGQAGYISNPAVLAAALAIHTVEARHAATLATLVPHGHVTPEGAFAKPATSATVLAAVKPFIA